MVCQPVRIALLLGAITAVAVSPARADVPCGPATRTIQCTEYVPETYVVKRTSYKVVCKQEEFTTCKWQCVPEVRERCVTKRVPVMTTETRKVCKTVTVNEERTCMKTCYKSVQETVMCKHLVSLGHWECKSYQPLFTGLFHNSCDPCNTCNSCNSCNTCKTRKVWVCCPQYQECPKTVCKKVCYQVPVKTCHPVCKRIEEVQTVQVCKYNCVQVQEKYTVYTRVQVPCKGTRTVRCCVPVEENVTCTRMVARCVTREVPCDSCGRGCGSCDTCGRAPLFGGLFRSNGCCCR
jgi:hypothetical protein